MALGSYFEQFDNAQLKEPFQASCSICSWYLLILLIASASHIKCFNINIVSILLHMEMLIFLSIVLHGPWLLWIVEGMMKTVWSHYKLKSIRLELHHIDSDVLRSIFVFYLIFHFLYDLIQEFWFVSSICMFLSLSLFRCNDFNSIPWHRTWFMVGHMPTNCNWWPLNLAACS